jgi:hypothetical protein
MKKLDISLFKLLEKAEENLHSKYGFNIAIQLIFEPLYRYCKK